MTDIFNISCNITPVKALKQHWTQTAFSYAKNPRPNFGIMLLINGEIDFVSTEETLCAKSRNVIFLPKDCCYEARFHIETGDIDNYLINFETDTELCGYTKPALIADNVSYSCFDLFRQFVEENYNLEKADFRSKGLFYLLMNALLEEVGNNRTKTDKVLTKAKKLLQQNDNCSIKQIARECLVSESGLRKIFKDSMGISPTQFRINERISKAKHLLESTDMSVDEIADELHFFDTAYFCKTFSKHVGKTPGKYSKNKRL